MFVYVINSLSIWIVPDEENPVVDPTAIADVELAVIAAVKVVEIMGFVNTVVAAPATVPPHKPAPQPVDTEPVFAAVFIWY